MIEVWKYWLQLWGFMPSDELQRVRAENELLKVQLEMAKAREAIMKGQPPAVNLPLDMPNWVDPFNIMKKDKDK